MPSSTRMIRRTERSYIGKTMCLFLFALTEFTRRSRPMHWLGVTPRLRCFWDLSNGMVR